MNGTVQHKQYLHEEGFAIIDNVFTEPEVAAIIETINAIALNRTVNNNKRRVIHLEFSNRLLPGGLQWAEYLPLTDFTAIS